MNPYLIRLRSQYDELRTAIEAIQTAAANAPAATEGAPAGRDLTEAELRSIETMNEQATALMPQIRSLTAIEEQHAEVADLRNRINGASTDAGQAGNAGVDAQSVGGDQVRATSSTTTQDRDPGHYRAVEQGGTHSFFGDQYRASILRDDDARTRINEHERALTMTGEGVGTTAPKWLFDRFEMVLRQGRKLADAVTNVPIGNDPRPMTLPKQTVGTSTVVADQSSENTAPATTDQFDTDVDTITPATVTGAQIFSRQFLDSATPAIDAMIFADLVANYNLQIEKRVGAAMVTAAGTAVTTFANDAAFVGTAPATPAIDAVIDAAIAVGAGRYLPADIVAMGTARWGAFRKLKDTSGRPLVPNGQHQVMNVYGVGDVNFNGELEGLGVIATEGISTGSKPESIVVARAADTLLFEGSLMRFRYEEVSGPQSVKVGIWNYAVVSVRRPGVGQKRIVVTA